MHTLRQNSFGCLEAMNAIASDAASNVISWLYANVEACSSEIFHHIDRCKLAGTARDQLMAYVSGFFIWRDVSSVEACNNDTLVADGLWQKSLEHV